MSIAHRKYFSFSLSSTALVVMAGALIMSAALGIRQTFGLFINPFSFDHGMPVTLIAFAIALHNLVWGIAQPFAGAAADRYGLCARRRIRRDDICRGPGHFGNRAVGGSAHRRHRRAGRDWYQLHQLRRRDGSCRSFSFRRKSEHGNGIGQRRRIIGTSAPRSPGTICNRNVGCISVASGACAPDAGDSTIWDITRPEESATQPHPHKPAIPLGEGVGPGNPTSGLWSSHDRFLRLRLSARLHRNPSARIPDPLPYAARARCDGVGSHRTIQHCGKLVLRLAWREVSSAIRPRLALSGQEHCRGGVLPAPEDRDNCHYIRERHGTGLAGCGPADQRFCGEGFSAHAILELFGVCFLSHQVGSFLGAWLGGFVFDITGSYSLIWGATVFAGLLAAILHFLIRDTAASNPVPVDLALA